MPDTIDNDVSISTSYEEMKCGVRNPSKGARSEAGIGDGTHGYSERFDTVTQAAILNRMTEIGCGWNPVYLAATLLDISMGRLLGTTTTFRIVKGVQKSWKVITVI